jgi:Family of unknown function (DUF6527)
VRAKPVKLVNGEGYVDVPTVEEATHVRLNFPGPFGLLTLPVIIKGTREGTGCWTWNGDTEKPTLRPSVLTQGGRGGKVRCHTWVTDGQAQFLDDCSHELRGQTVDMLEVTA